MFKYFTVQCISINPKGIKCGNYGKSRDCKYCPVVYPKDSCSEDCGWVTNQNSSMPYCGPKGKYPNSRFVTNNFFLFVYYMYNKYISCVSLQLGR